MMKLYGIQLSQPYRTIEILCKMAAIPFEFQKVDLATKQQHSSEFKQINPNSKVPVLVDGDLTVFESTAIIRYICNKYPHETRALYPKTSVSEVYRIEEFLTFYHKELRQIVYLLIVRFMMKNGKDFDGYKQEAEKFNNLEDLTASKLTAFEQNYLQKDYILGSSASICDILALCEIMELNLMNFDLTPYPKISAWIGRFKHSQVVRESHEVIKKMVKKREVKYWLD